MNSIYVESQTLYQNKPAFKWLDKCGARWVDGTPFEDYRTRQPYIGFTKDGFAHFPSSMKPDTQSHTHTPTALEFCQGVARILGIPEPTFEEDKDKAFWDSEQAIFDRAKNNPMVIDPALYGAKVKPKGMAIECDKLTQDQKEWVDSVRGRQSDWEDWSYCVILKPSGVVDIYLTSESEVNDVLGVTITDSPTEFLEYVAQQTGKEYKMEPTFGEVTGHVLTQNEIDKIIEFDKPEPKGMAIDLHLLSKSDRSKLEELTIGSATLENGHDKYLRLKNGKIWAVSKERIESLGYTITDSSKVFLEYVAQQTGKEYQPNIVNLPPNIEQKMLYPNHKNYRILDSLDGIPLDTRIPLSEWIPPMGAEVLWVIDKSAYMGHFGGLNIDGLVILDSDDVMISVIDNLDGHWMRIV